jgi:hypothetical protein
MGYILLFLRHVGSDCLQEAYHHGRSAEVRHNLVNNKQ